MEWWAATQKAYPSLLEHGTWGKILRKDVPTAGNRLEILRLAATGLQDKATSRNSTCYQRLPTLNCIDYNESVAVLSRVDSVCCIVVSAMLREWELHRFNAVNAFLHRDVDSSTYMELSEGFEGPGYVCRTRPFLYSLR